MRISVLAVLVGVLAASAACGGDDENISVPSNPVTPVPSPATPTPTFTDVFNDVLVVHCASCHMTPGGIGITLGKLDMTGQATAFANLVNVPAAGSACAGDGTRVVPGDTQSSIMFLKVSLDDPAPCGDKMPLGGPSLSRDETDMIAGWITAGALDN